MAITLSSLLIFCLFFYSIYRKEEILKSCELVLLELVPYDPRSIMQGDYMNLAFAVEEKSLKAKPPAQSGFLVIELDKNKVGQFNRFYNHEPLKENEKLIRFKFNPKEIRRSLSLKPNSFFFQEGQGQYFSKAKFAILHYNGHQDYVLIGLADENRHKIEPPKTTFLENLRKSP